MYPIAGHHRREHLAALPVRLRAALPRRAVAGVLEIWTDEFDWRDRHVDAGVLTVCMHPQVIGRGHRMAMLERFVAQAAAAAARFARLGDVARALD
jgi:hypothetical protein